MSGEKSGKPARQRPVLRGGRKSVLIVLFVPSVQRDGTTPIDQQHWVDAAEPMQLAALLLEKTTEQLSEDEAKTLIRPRRQASRT